MLCSHLLNRALIGVPECVQSKGYDDEDKHADQRTPVETRHAVLSP